MSQLCPYCGSKYTTDKGIANNTKKLAHKYYCESCRKTFEVAVGVQSADGEWLMTFWRFPQAFANGGGLINTDNNFIAVYRALDGKIQINQRYTDSNGQVSYFSGEITPRVYVVKINTSYSLYVSTKQGALDNKGISMDIYKIEMSPTIAMKANANDAMRGMRGRTDLSSENKMLMDDCQAFLQSVMGAPTNEGCYIATAVYGSYACPQVWTLRRFRDNTLASTWYGRAFIRTYYAISPTLVKWFGHTTWFKNMWRSKLDKMVDILQKQGVESTPYQDKHW